MSTLSQIADDYLQLRRAVLIPGPYHIENGVGLLSELDRVDMINAWRAVDQYQIGVLAERGNQLGHPRRAKQVAGPLQVAAGREQRYTAESGGHYDMVEFGAVPDDVNQPPIRAGWRRGA